MKNGNEAITGTMPLHSATLLYSILEGTPDPVAAFDLEFRFIAFNSAYRSAFKAVYGVDIALGTSIKAALSHLPSEQQQVVSILSRARIEERFTVVEEFGDRGLTRKYFEVRIGAIRDENGYFAGSFQIARDITEARRLQEDVANAQERLEARVREATDLLKERTKTLEATFTQATVGIARIGLDGRYISVNQKLCDITGYSREELLEKTFSEVTFLADQGESFSHWKAMLHGETASIAHEKRYIRKDGALRWVSVGYSLVKDEAGKPLFGVAIVADIDERKSAEDALKSSEATLAGILNATQESILLFDTQGTVLMANRIALARLNKTAIQVLGRTHREVLPPELALSRMAYLREVVADKSPVEFEDERAGIVFAHSYYPVFDEYGRVTAVVSISRDVTMERRTELELREREARFRTLANTVPHVVWTAGPDGLVDYFNDRIYEYDGAIFENGVWRWDGAVHPDDREKSWLEVAAGIHEKRDTRIEHRLRTKSGEYRWHLTRGKPVLDQNGEIAKWFGTVTDIHEQKRVAEALAKAKESAERVSQLKSSFLANMSHEIRTPLGAMLGFADLLRDPALSEAERLSYIDILIRNGEQLSVIIDDILDLSKVEAGHLSCEFTDFNPMQVVADVVSLFKLKAQEKGLELSFSSGLSTPQTVTSDPTRVRQILLNLIGNSIKFTRLGSVQVRSYGERDSEGRDVLCLEIEDTGIGIPAEQQDRVFEMFVQADGSMTRRFGGTGLGLALSRKLAHALCGDITIVRSEPGKGTLFKVCIVDRKDLKESQQASSAAVQREAGGAELVSELEVLERCRVLVVDDAVDNRQLISRYLTKRGVVVDVAVNGLEAFRKALEGDYDLVLMDIQMPEMDGYTATEKLRAAGFRKPIIALTAHAMTEARARCMNVGCTDFLTKPINSQALLSKIAYYIQT